MAKTKKPKSFLVTYHSGAAAAKKMKDAKPPEMQAMMQAWMEWAEKCGSNLTDMGAPLQNGINLKATGTATVSSRKVSGYSMLSADTMAQAKKLLKGHPHLSWARGCEIEVHEVKPM